MKKTATTVAVAGCSCGGSRCCSTRDTVLTGGEGEKETDSLDSRGRENDGERWIDDTRDSRARRDVVRIGRGRRQVRALHRLLWPSVPCGRRIALRPHGSRVTSLLSPAGLSPHWRRMCIFRISSRRTCNALNRYLFDRYSVISVEHEKGRRRLSY